MRRCGLLVAVVTLLVGLMGRIPVDPSVEASACSGTSAQVWVWIDGDRYDGPPACVPAPGGWSKLTDAYANQEKAGYGAGTKAAVYSPV